MVPVYATVSFLSFLYYRHAVYFEVLRDCYEAFAIASFFTLLCHYIADDLHQQKNYFRTIRPKAWIWPIPWLQKCWGGEHGIWRTPRSGLTWFNVRRVAPVLFSVALLISADNLDRRLSVLLHPGLHDTCCGCHPGLWSILSELAEPGLCPHLGYGY